jgi:tetratricopeptide (TPR) repeat protein
VESLRQAERLEPDRTLTLIALGLALNNRKLFAESKPVLLRSLEREPDSVEGTAALAEAEEGLSELGAAEDHARRVLGRAEGNATANLVMGLVLMKQARYTEARESLEKAAAADPGSPKAHYQLSLALARLGDDAGAQRELALYRQCLEEVEQRLRQVRGQTGPGGMAQ